MFLLLYFSYILFVVAAVSSSITAMSSTSNTTEQSNHQGRTVINNSEIPDDDIVTDIIKSILDRTIAFRYAIAYCFMNRFQCAENSEETPWFGRNDIIPQIRNALGIPKGTPNSSVESVLKDVLNCKHKGCKYVPEVKHGGGREAKIPLDSPEAQIIADVTEAGLSIRTAWTIVNLHCELEQQDSYMLSAVQSCITRLKPLQENIDRRKQGTTDPHSASARARLRWALQLAIRFQLYTDVEIRALLVKHQFYSGSGPLPKQFDKSRLSKLSIDQFVCWDEVNSKVQAGSAQSTVISSNKQTTYKFKRDENGKLDPNGKFSDEECSIMRTKFSDEIRLSIGVGVVTPINPDTRMPMEQEGRRCKPFVYTGKSILSIKEYKKRVNNEINRVRGLKSGESSGWVVRYKHNKGDPLYDDDPVSYMVGCGKLTTEMLKKHGIEAVRDFIGISEDTMKKILECIPSTRIDMFIGQAEQTVGV